MDNGRSPRYMIEVSADAIRRNIYNRDTNIPVWGVVNAANSEQVLFVHGIKMFDAETITSITELQPCDYVYGSAYLVTTRGIDVQLRFGGAYVNLFDAIESGTVEWSTWAAELEKYDLLDDCT